MIFSRSEPLPVFIEEPGRVCQRRVDQQPAVLDRGRPRPAHGQTPSGSQPSSEHTDGVPGSQSNSAEPSS